MAYDPLCRFVNPSRLAGRERRVRRLIGSLALLLLASACAHFEPGNLQRRVDYRCEDGTTVQMRFFPAQGVGVLVQDNRPRELQQQAVASGFGYAAPGLVVRGQGDELRLEVAGMPPRICRVV